MAAFTWDDPYRTGFAGKMYDPGTMYGLILRAQSGDLAAKNHLSQNGFFDAQGNDVWGAYTPNAGAPGTTNMFGAVDQWAKARGLQQYNGANPFKWNSTWGSASAPGFQQAWDRQWSMDQTPPPGQQPTPNTPPVGGGQNATGGPLSALATGAGQAQVGANAPAWARFTAGNTGASYAAVAKTFDPWGNWGQYGPNQAKAIARHQVGNRMETDIDRVYRWTNDILRTQYGLPGGEGADPALRTQIFLANVERLKNDYKNNGLDWNTSAFADMERGNAILGGGGGQQPPPVTGGGGGGQQTPPVDPATGLPVGYKGTNAGATGDGMTAAQRLMISADPNQAYRYMMQQLGYNPSAPGLLGNFLKKRFQPLLEARMAAAGVSDNANYMDQIDQIVNDFGGNLFQKGGNFFGNLRETGTQAAQAGRPFLDSLQDQNQAMQYMAQLGMLRYAGSNPLVQQSVADEMQRGREEFQDLSFEREGQGQNLDPFTAWLQQSRYRNYFGF